MKAIILFSFTILVGLFFMRFTTCTKIRLEGAWRIVEVRTVKPDNTYSSTFPKESLVLFANGYYSFCWTSHTSPTRSWQMSDSTKLNRFNQSIINSGTYKVENTLLTTSAQFAQNPMFVGGSAQFECSNKGDTLILTGVNLISADNVQNPIYAGGAHIVNFLVRNP